MASAWFLNLTSDHYFYVNFLNLQFLDKEPNLPKFQRLDSAKKTPDQPTTMLSDYLIPFMSFHFLLLSSSLLFYLTDSSLPYRRQLLASVSDRTGFNQVSGSGSGFRNRITDSDSGSGSRRAKITHKKKKFHVLKCWMFSFEGWMLIQ